MVDTLKRVTFHRCRRRILQVQRRHVEQLMQDAKSQADGTKGETSIMPHPFHDEDGPKCNSTFGDRAHHASWWLTISVGS